MELTHASFFSGVGGLDLGLERAGWRTVSFSEIDPYANAVLAERWPGVPNLGDITALRTGIGTGRELGGTGNGERAQSRWLPRESADAVLWSGGFPCQDLSVAGKRAGFAGDRSVLAFAFLDLVERHRPPAILLENVPGLLSSPPTNPGADFARLLREMADLGYWWAYRILDAQFFGVPQRRRRVFVVALHAGAGFGADSAAAVLSVGSRCEGHSAAGDETGEGIAASVVGSLDTALGHHGAGWPAQSVASGHVIADGQHGSAPDPGGVREANGLAGRVDGGGELAGAGAPVTTAGVKWGEYHQPALSPTLRVGPQRPQDGGPGDTVPIIVGALNGTKERGGWRAGPDEAAAGHVIVNALYQRRGDVDDNEAQAGHLIAGQRLGDSEGRHSRNMVGTVARELLPAGLDSHRYRCCGNGVVAPVSEWIGWRLRRAVEEMKVAT